MRFTRSVTLALLATSFFLSVAGCGGQKKEVASGKAPVEIKVAFWGAPDEVNVIQDIIDRWQQAHPDIIVRLEHTPYRGYVDKLLTRLAGRAAPDIICTEVDLFVTFQSKGVLLDLTPYVEKDDELSMDAFYPEVVDRFTVDGRLYAIPRDTAPFACIYYNKKLFDKAGLPYPTDDWDVNDLLERAKRLTKFDAEGRVEQYGFYAWAWQNFVYAFGGRLVDNVKNPTTCLLDSKESIEGLRFYADLINKYRVHPTPTAMTSLAMGVQAMFMTERLAMFSSGIWETPGLHKIDAFEWDVVMFPKGPKGVRAFGTGGSGYCILNQTKHPKEAFEVIKALSGRDGQIMLAKIGLAQPAMKDIAESVHWAFDGKPPGNKKMLTEAVKYAIYDPFHPAWREAKEVYILPELDSVFSGTKTVEEAASNFTDNVNELLKKR